MALRWTGAGMLEPSDGQIRATTDGTSGEASAG